MGMFPRAPGRVGGGLPTCTEGPHFLVSGNSGERDGSDGRALRLGEGLDNIRRDGTLAHDAGFG